MPGKPIRRKWYFLFILIFGLSTTFACGEVSIHSNSPAPSLPAGTSIFNPSNTPRLALWLAKKDDLLAYPDARYALIMSGWFEPSEVRDLKSRDPSSRIFAGLSPTWVMADAGWQAFLLSVANGGDPNGSLQITPDMYLMFDDNGDGQRDRRCSPPGWDNIYAMDPRDTAWIQLILAFYTNVAAQPQHDGLVLDMLDAYPFCDGASSGAVPTPIDSDSWVSAQAEIVRRIRSRLPAGKWIVANAGHDFPPGSPFPQYLNGYLLENFLGSWGASFEEGLASARRALQSTLSPHIVVFAVDTDDTGVVDMTRFRLGLVASFLMDNTYFAYDYGSRDHGGVTGWWFPGYCDVDLGAPLAPYTLEDGVYRRDFENAVVVASPAASASVSFDSPYIDLTGGEKGTRFTIPSGDARIFIRPSE